MENDSALDLAQAFEVGGMAERHRIQGWVQHEIDTLPPNSNEQKVARRILHGLLGTESYEELRQREMRSAKGLRE